MKIIKRFTALLLAAVLGISTFNVSAFAAPLQETTEDEVTLFDASGTPKIDQSFNFVTTHTGSVRTYNSNTISYRIWFWKGDGSTLTDGTILAVRLYTESGVLVQENQFGQSSNGYGVVNDIPITYGGRYYFQYVVAYGTPSLRVWMRIYY